MTQKLPLIGIVLDYKSGSKDSYSIRPHYAIRCNYVEMINKAGGVAILLPYDFAAISTYLSLIDGLMIVGGHFDIHPKKYGEKEIHESVTLNETREEFESALTSCALKTNLPILGICNGMQLINVLFGGNIIQHIPEAGNFLNHEQSKTENHDSSKSHHLVNIDSSSILHKIVGVDAIQTNSSHHQAIKNVVEPLKISARASDGIIEAIENPLHPFCIGVQWHPEFDVSAADRKIFESFIDAAKNFHIKHTL